MAYLIRGFLQHIVAHWDLQSAPCMLCSAKTAALFSCCDTSCPAFSTRTLAGDSHCQSCTDYSLWYTSKHVLVSKCTCKPASLTGLKTTFSSTLLLTCGISWLQWNSIGLRTLSSCCNVMCGPWISGRKKPARQWGREDSMERALCGWWHGSEVLQ